MYLCEKRHQTQHYRLFFTNILVRHQTSRTFFCVTLVLNYNGLFLYWLNSFMGVWQLFFVVNYHTTNKKAHTTSLRKNTPINLMGPDSPWKIQTFLYLIFEYSCCFVCFTDFRHKTFFTCVFLVVFYDKTNTETAHDLWKTIKLSKNYRFGHKTLFDKKVFGRSFIASYWSILTFYCFV